MDFEKKPVRKSGCKEYPSIRMAKTLKRRKFFTLIGGGASAVLLASCYKISDEDQGSLDDLQDRDSDYDQPTNDTDYNPGIPSSTDEMEQGDNPIGEIFNLRLPLTGGQTTHLLDEEKIYYAIYTQHEAYWFNEYVLENQLEILGKINEFLNGLFLDEALLMQEADSNLVIEIAKIIELCCANAELGDPNFYSIRLEFIDALSVDGGLSDGGDGDAGTIDGG